MSVFLAATIFFGLVFLASLISVRFGIAAAVCEITFGVIAGNFFQVPNNLPFIAFLASFGSIYLTFQAGTEVDIDLFKKHFREAVLIGGAAFFVPFVFEFAAAYWLLGWTFGASDIAALALSTTSLAVVYAVLVETGLSRTAFGKRLMAATFVEDALTAIFLTLLFLHFNLYSALFVAASIAALIGLPRIYPWLVERFGNKVVEPELKFLFLCLFLLEWLGSEGNNQPGLPAFFLGLVLSRFLTKHKALRNKMRTAAFAMVTPFFFFQGGLNVNLREVEAALAVTTLFLTIKFVTKFAGVFPFAKRYHKEDSVFTTLLMSTGLTFGTISSLYGLNQHIISATQFSVLITVVIVSAVLPTITALKYFPPQSEAAKDIITIGGEEG